MAFEYKVIGSISQTSGVTGYPCRLVVGEGSPIYGAPKSGRYIKFTIASNWGDNSLCAMTSLWACGKNGTKLNNEGMTHTKSTILNGSAEACSNTNTSDYWQWYIDQAPATWTVDLGSSQSIYYIKTQVLVGKQPRNMKDFTVHVSDNGSDWTLVLDTQTADSTSLQTFQVADSFDVCCNGHCRSDFGDIRFFDGSDNVLDYWIDWGTLTGTTPNQSVEVWVKTAAATGGTTVKLKYGDAALDDASDGTAVFTKFKDFESGDDGTALSTADGDWTTVTGTAEIDTAQKASGSKSAKLVGGAAATDINIAQTAGTGYAIRVYFRKSNGAGDSYVLLHGNGTKQIVILCDSSENIKYKQGDGTAIDTGVNCAVDTWEWYEARNIDFTAYTYDLWHEGACLGADLPMNTSAASANILRFYNAATSAGNDTWIDDLIVRKYANPEPVWGTWGEEKLEFTPDKEASDSGTGAETSVISITSSDSGTGGESSSFYDPSVFWPAEGSDSGTGTDSSTAPEATLPTLTDSGTGSDDYSEKFILFANATIAAYSLGGYLPTGSAGTDWPDEFQLFETDDYLGDPLIQEGLLSLTDSYTHVPVTLSAEVKSATLSPCYIDDYYYRIHVVPNYIDLGQMLSEETHDITIWNAYFVPQTMSSVTEVSTDGIDLSEPVTVPYEMAPLEEITYEASVTMSGPSTIGATIYFNFSALFPASTLYCMIVGSRVMVWLWMPREEFTEELHWNTNVLQTRNGEQRIAYLDAPRQTYNFSFSLPSDRYSDVKTSVDKFAHGVWGLPIWKEHSTVSATVGASAIDFDTSCADYQEGGWAMLWESPDKATALLIDTVRADGIDIDPVLGETYENAWIMPMQRAILPEGMEFTRTPGQEAAAMASFLCNDTVDLSDTSPYPQYRSYDVVTNGHYAIDDLSERIIRPTTQIDNGQGPITVLETQDYTQFARTLGLWTETKEDLWALRQWLHARRGRQKPFWLPTYNQDFTLAATITALTTDIEITGGRALSVYGTFPCDFMMELTDGSIYYRRIVTATTAPGGNTTMSIDSAIGREVTRSQIVLWCFMDLVRFNSDAITLRHRNPYFVDASVPLMRVPE